MFGVVSSANFKVESFSPLYFVDKYIVSTIALLIKPQQNLMILKYFIVQYLKCLTKFKCPKNFFVYFEFYMLILLRK